MRRETDQHGRSARDVTKDKMDPHGRRKSGQQKRRMWLGILWNWRWRGTWPTGWLMGKGKHWTDESQQHEHMTSMKKIDTKERKKAHHKDKLQGLGDGGQKPQVKHFERLRLHQGVAHHGQRGRRERCSAVSASLVGDLPDHTLVASHHCRAFGRPRLSRCTIERSLALIASRVVS